MLHIDGKKVHKVGEVEVGGLPEGAAFTPDGKYLYVGNYLDSDLSILKVDGDKITPVKRMKLPGHPASVRMSDKEDASAARGRTSVCWAASRGLVD